MVPQNGIPFIVTVPEYWLSNKSSDLQVCVRYSFKWPMKIFFLYITQLHLSATNWVESLWSLQVDQSGDRSHWRQISDSHRAKEHYWRIRFANYTMAHIADFVVWNFLSRSVCILRCFPGQQESLLYFNIFCISNLLLDLKIFPFIIQLGLFPVVKLEIITIYLTIVFFVKPHSRKVN